MCDICVRTTHDDMMLAYGFVPIYSYLYNLKLAFCSLVLQESGCRVTWLSRYLPLSLITLLKASEDRLCGLVVRVPGYRSGSPCSIPGTTRKK
jgi:hypothetical protein